MRICHGLAGEVVEVDISELRWRKPIDLVRQHATERWNIAANDLIMLTSGGGTLGANTGAEDIGASCDIFFFPKSCLEAEAPAEADRLDPDSPSLANAGIGGEAEDDVVGQRCEDVIDPAFETFRSNIAEARKRIAESRPMAALAASAEERLAVQRLAARSVLDNLTNHRATCKRSMTLLAQKHTRVQSNLQENLERVEASMKALETVELHPALQTAGRASLADLVPQDKILRFVSGLESERAQLLQRLEKLQRQDAQLQATCNTVLEKVHQLLKADSTEVSEEAQDIQKEQAHALEQLPALRALVPSAGAAPASVLEDEKRSAQMLEKLTQTCKQVSGKLPQLQACWDRQHQTFVQRLREVSLVQTKVRNVERQAALLEEEINAQFGYSQQLSRLQKMPRAYHRTLQEVARRRKFGAHYVAQGEKARNSLSRMVEEENQKRRSFLSRYSCYLPADLVQGLGALVPPATLEVPSFDSQLPDIDASSLPEIVDGAATGTRERASSMSSCSSSPRGGAAAAASFEPGGEASQGLAGSSSSPVKPFPKSSEEASVASASAENRIAELEAQKKALEEHLASLRQEQASSCQ
eukprot:TRINITY_DN93378_c0_g1_i1.p1 TRINITY_DN93378_c0_g1~~TRINITY_DN93378_c0_g1_i1.p1  ORF type:complete len:587 (-),score=162.54 TRINITY_DN93378_c0_g1_i1:20-1780(-)